MTRTVKVTLAQKMAAQALVARSAETGRPLSKWVVKIAEAQAPTGPASASN
jgi:hypothetical protein